MTKVVVIGGSSLPPGQDRPKKLIKESGILYSIVRAAQFYEFVVPLPQPLATPFGSPRTHPTYRR